MTQSFIRTKLNIPSLRKGVLDRADLIQSLENSADCRLILITAPAGYGKTTLVAQWIKQQNRPACWLTLDTGDNVPDIFFNLLMAAIHQSAPEFDALPFPPQLDDSALSKAAISGLINSLADLEQSLVVVLDDFHLLTHPAIHSHLDTLIENLSPNITFVITSRERPTVLRPRWLARGWAAELSQEDLKFNLDQSSQFFRDMMGVSISDELVEIVNNRVDGWVTGLQFTGLRLQKVARTEEMIDHLSFDKIDHLSASYLLEEVLEKESLETQYFLISTSILNRLSAPLCDALLQTNSAQSQLEDIESRSLFTNSLDDQREWYRYHPLMAELLQEKLHQGQEKFEIARLHRVAAIWYEQNGLLEEGIRHAFAAEDFEMVASYLLKVKTSFLWQENGSSNLASWLSQLPEHYLIDYPKLGILAVGTNLVRSELKNTMSLLQQLEGKEEIESYWRAIQGNIKRNAGQINEALIDLELALEDLDWEDPIWVLLVHLQTVLCYREKGDLSTAQKLIHQVVQSFAENEPQDDPIFISIMLNWLQGILGMIESDILRAQSFFEAGYRLIKKVPIHRRAIQGYILSGLSRVYYLQNDLARSKSLAEQASEIGKRTSITDFTISGAIQLIDVAVMQSDKDAVRYHLNELQTLIRASKFEPFSDLFQLLFISANFKIGNKQMGNDWAMQHDYFNKESLLLIEREAYILWARVHLDKVRGGDPADNHEVALDQLVSFCERLLALSQEGSDFLLELNTRLILAEGYDLWGSVGNRNTQVTRAIEMGKTGGILQPFFEFKSLIAKFARETPPQEDPFVNQIITAAGTSTTYRPEQNSLSELTGRELEILQALADGLSNKEIESRHVISRNTVRTHLRNLYSKLDVTSRTQAVLKGQEMGLI